LLLLLLLLLSLWLICRIFRITHWFVFVRSWSQTKSEFDLSLVRPHTRSISFPSESLSAIDVGDFIARVGDVVGAV
jgi:hypothetical protein